MSYLLWKFYYEDDAESFCHLLGEAQVAGRAAAQKGYPPEQNSLPSVSPAAFSASYGPKQGTQHDAKSHAAIHGAQVRFGEITLSRLDLNRRDAKGLTLLHHAASSENESAKTFALALIAHPLTDIHIQDLENGWNALHRAFYFGNISVARAILERESQDAIGPSGLNVQAASLIKTKDWEGNGPWDILTATIADRTLRHVVGGRSNQARSNWEDDDEADGNQSLDADNDRFRRPAVEPHVNLQGDELLTFGSNKNFTLGLNDQDDRQFPERVKLKRPDHLFRKFHREHVELRAAKIRESNPQYASRIEAGSPQQDDHYFPPSIIRSKPISILDVQMSKFHTAILTNDPFPNLYMCGHGLGGRLGVGDERTRFNFVCIEDFGSIRRRIVAIALGQDHTLAITDQGDLFAWGSNSFGQLGLGFTKSGVETEEPPQLTPKKIFGPLKKEVVVGVAASRIHSVVHTTSDLHNFGKSALYTFGKNEGQLGIVDSQSGSLKYQSVPRRVDASHFSSAIVSVSAIDRATVCLLENHQIYVFANYGITKIIFPLDRFANPLSEKSDTATRYDAFKPSITKVTCGGNTICALSNAGEIFAVTVDQRVDPGSSATASTTNPNKIKQALSQPSRIWSLKKGHMSARDVAVDQDGSVIITTEAGSVWRRIHRATLSKTRILTQNDKKSKEFKITRVPGLTRVIAVRASASGAYCSIRSECDVTKSQFTSEKTIWKDMVALIPFKNLVKEQNLEHEAADSQSPSSRNITIGALIHTLAEADDLEKTTDVVLRTSPNEQFSNHDVLIKASNSEVKIPSHTFLLAGRSRMLRDVFSSVRAGTSWSDDLISASQTKQGVILMEFKGVDFMTIVEFSLYAYTDQFVGFWLRSRHAPALAYRYRQIRLELLKIAAKLDLRSLEAAVRKMALTAPACLDTDLEMAVADLRYFENSDALIQLSDGEVAVHSDFVSSRCPFFEGLFQGRAAGKWLDERRGLLESPNDRVSIDFSHVELHIFQLVLRHIYADTGEELFDDIVSKDLDEFLDTILDVLSVANELMLDRLSQICQSLLGRYVNTRNVCTLLNAIAPCAVTEFKTLALEYICLNLEALLSNHLLDELDDDLLDELDEVVRDNQLSSLPVVKSGHADAVLHDKYPDLAEMITRDRQSHLDRMRMLAKYSDQRWRAAETSLNVEKDEVSGNIRSIAPTASAANTGRKPAPALTPKSTEMKTAKDYFGSPPSATSEKSPLLRPNPNETTLLSSSTQLALPSPSAGEESTPLATEDSSSLPEAISDRAKAWGRLPLASAKLGMKEIMQQASSSRTSNLSLGFASQAKAGEDSKRTPPKMSQKERKRQQLGQQDLEVSSKAPPGSTSSATSIQPSSPWQKVPSKPKPVIQESPSQAEESVPSTKPNTARSASTPQLTMRQTIANSPSTPKEKVETPTLAPQTPQQQRTTSTPQSSASKTTPPGPSSGSATKPMEIQSIRHIPKETSGISPTSQRHYSLADIRSQQLAEKQTVKEAVAKRSLQEIQQEQEFQQWWDQESRRVMAEEAAAVRAAKKQSNRGRGRGGRGRGGRGRGKSKEESGGSASHTAASTEANS